VLHYFDRVVKPYPARVIVFYAGDNDIATTDAGARPDDYRTSCSACANCCPNAHHLCLDQAEHAALANGRK